MSGRKVRLLIAKFYNLLTFAFKRRHNDRLSASETEKASEDAITPDEDKATEVDKVAEGDNASEQEQSTGEENQEESAGEDNEEPTAGATSLTVSILSTLVLAWIL